ncbi:DUF4350 domain-containing protein [Terricaulis silvestris]|uniref:DUF4350 domain-containing protein n=1 Tax=Terricaulis silvestris TaxID=2686094 RepID=A0A6I6MPY6_9CAUL|nr:DUF4350 domain-containing protein [Terricaulis silvestris]QGZ96779.1 hypothetical protein DSM104635_03640 [Terricaulis silvestris]
MHKIAGLVGLFLFGGIASLAALLFFQGQRPDYTWHPSATPPAFVNAHPRVLIDEGHHNASTAGLFGRYMPLARLLKAEGYDVVRGNARFTDGTLASTGILVIANASGAARLQFWGFNLPIGDRGDRGAAAFTALEIEAVRAWVERGGSLLLIADHAPFGAASAQLAAAFDVTMRGGSVEIPGATSDPLPFEQGALGDHPILSGVDQVFTFSGQSLSGPADATILLRLPHNAIEYVEVSRDEAAGTTTFEDQPAGPAQGLALNYGAGRVVVLGEAAMLTAQVRAGRPFGLSAPGGDNERFARNVMRWLAHDD